MNAEKNYYYPYGCKFLHEKRSTSGGTVFEAWKFEFECNWRSNRSGFVHEGSLYFDWSYYPVQENKIQYYNRTWERFSYESLIKDLFLDFVYRKDRRFLEENKGDIIKISEDLDLNFWKVFKVQKLKEELLEKYN